MMVFIERVAGFIKKIGVTLLMAILFPVMIFAAIVAVCVEAIQSVGKKSERSRHKAVIANKPVIADEMIYFPGHGRETGTHPAVS